MPKTDLYAGLGLMAFGLITLFVLIPAQTSDGGDATISPALLPQLCAIGITGLAVLLVLQAAGKIRRGKPAGKSVPRSEWASAAAVIVAVCGGVALFKFVNPAVAAGLLIVGLMLFMGERRIYFVVGIPAFLLIGAWLLFYKVLGTAIG